MLERLSIAAVLALLGLFATTGITAAAKSPDLTAVAGGTFLVALGAMAFLFIIYLIKVASGLEKRLPPEEPGAPEHH